MTRQPAIDPTRIAAACADLTDLPLEELLPQAVGRVTELYPELISPRERWIFTKAGGIVGKVLFLYAGINEYLLLFGARTTTQGFSGRYKRVAIHKVILAGQYTTHDPESSQMRPTVFGAGELVPLPKGEVRNTEIAGGSWHFEHGHGPVVTAMPFGTVDLVVSAMEVRPILQTTVDYSHFMGRALSRKMRRRR